jgi:hypothetical protein
MSWFVQSERQNVGLSRIVLIGINSWICEGDSVCAESSQIQGFPSLYWAFGNDELTSLMIGQDPVSTAKIWWQLTARMGGSDIGVALCEFWETWTFIPSHRDSCETSELFLTEDEIPFHDLFHRFLMNSEFCNLTSREVWPKSI